MKPSHCNAEWKINLQDSKETYTFGEIRSSDKKFVKMWKVLRASATIKRYLGSFNSSSWSEVCKRGYIGALMPPMCGQCPNMNSSVNNSACGDVAQSNDLNHSACGKAPRSCDLNNSAGGKAPRSNDLKNSACGEVARSTDLIFLNSLLNSTEPGRRKDIAGIQVNFFL